MNKYIKRQVIPVKYKIGDILSFGKEAKPILNVTLQNKIPLYDFGGGLRLMHSEIEINCNPTRYADFVQQHTAKFPDEPWNG